VLAGQVVYSISTIGRCIMSKGYIVANIRVTDQDRFQEFSGMAGPAIKKYGGRVLARGPDADRLEGNVRGIVMMIEFESKEAADTFYHSEEYQAAKAVREECSDTDFMIIEGVSD
jgi:uncharacterized protein (DUF1330 family)